MQVYTILSAFNSMIPFFRINKWQFHWQYDAQKFLAFKGQENTRGIWEEGKYNSEEQERETREEKRLRDGDRQRRGEKSISKKSSSPHLYLL